MAVRTIDSTVADSRNNVTMPNDPTRIDPMKLKLGKQVARHDPRTLLLASYISARLPDACREFRPQRQSEGLGHDGQRSDWRFDVRGSRPPDYGVDREGRRNHDLTGKKSRREGFNLEQLQAEFEDLR